MCDCDCYDFGKCVIAELPPEIATDRENRSVCLDRCIADTIRHLWNNGIQTLGCCCGHNKEKPNVVIAQNEDIQNVCGLINSVDDRQWDVCRWELVKYES